MLFVGLMSGAALTSGKAAADLADLVSNPATDQAVQIALETRKSGSTYHWQSLDGEVFGAVTPRRTFRATSGFYCREYLEMIADGSDAITVVHIACRAEDGNWVVVEE